MQLKTIKLSGFKSFVDPTVIHFPSQLIGVVGPNGCGKSNIIDAVRWVMGESSAKNLRGGALTDVIFNGTNERKPVSLATVELIFDNADKRLGTQYAQCAEISVKREVNRDAQSNYYLNNVRCRRRDITDLFSGTGLGPRSYSIIEQNTVSNLIEAKPEVLRTYIEEAAGLSQYKEHRKETENRIERTQANLERLNDLREELAERLETLDAQAQAAENYKNNKQIEREILAKLSALRWQQLDKQITQKQAAINQLETHHENSYAEIQNIDAKINAHQIELTEANESYNKTQAKFYSVGSEISHTEQQTEFHKQGLDSASRQIEHQQQTIAQAKQSIQSKQEWIETIKQEQEEIAPKTHALQIDFEHAQTSEEKATAAMQTWQLDWDNFNETYSTSYSDVQVKQAQLDSIHQQIAVTERKLAALKQKQAENKSVDLEKIQAAEQSLKECQEQEIELEQTIQALEPSLQASRQAHSELAKTIVQQQEALSVAKGKQASFLALQEQTTQQGKKQKQWLSENNMQDSKQLYQAMKVESGYEKAVETVLSEQINAICLDDDAGFQAICQNVQKLEEGRISFITSTSVAKTQSNKATSLLDKIHCEFALSPFLENIFLCDDLNSALALRESLAAQESVITKDGIWLGKNWLKYQASVSNKTGILERKNQLSALEKTIAELVEQTTASQEQLTSIQKTIDEQETQRSAKHSLFSELRKKTHQLNDTLTKLRTDAHLVNEQAKQIEVEQSENNQLLTDLKQKAQSLHSALCKEREQLSRLESEKSKLSERRLTLQHDVSQARSLLQQKQNELHQFNLKIQQLNSEHANAKEKIDTLQITILQSETTIEASQQETQKHETKIKALSEQHQMLLQQKFSVEAELKEKQLQLEAIQESIRAQQHRRSEKEFDLEKTRTELESVKVDCQTQKVKAENLLEQLTQTQLTIDAVLKSCTQEDTLQNLEKNLNKTRQVIQNLGSINLMAIEEFEKQSERKRYLDAQNQDLVQALETLMDAIRKIDTESRRRFKDTFETINEGLQNLFPKVFGGGQAYMELTSHDPLDAGVTIMARPPGKKNSSIQMLSGGEKALTALSLVFSIFQLNPAPFCLLDEVDAPLDDVNVGRFCALIKEMSKDVQFIIVTHNKISMEMMTHLAGVTMREPGVSRLVAVDIEKAMALAEA